MILKGQYCTVYSDRPETLNLDLARQSAIEALRLERGGPSPGGKADEESRLSEVAASQNSKSQADRSITSTKFIHGKGCHGKNVQVVDAGSKPDIPDCDGLVTKTPGLTLLMTFADCQIAFIYDPIHHVIANIHSGWRGSVQNIYGEAVDKMKSAFGSKPEDLLVCISPSLGPDEAEFMHYRRELPEEFWHFQPRPTYFDFWSISEAQLQAAGVLPHHIEVARLSTYSNPHDFFSYRRDKVTGRHAACLSLL